MQPQLREVLSGILETDNISENDSVETIRTWDSVRHLRLVLAIEETFGITFDAAEIPELISVPAIEAAIASRQLIAEA
jgi:acyl carrier protein